MSETELYKELGTLTEERIRWKESIPYAAQLRKMSENDSNRVVRIHSIGALKAMGEEKTI